MRKKKKKALYLCQHMTLLLQSREKKLCIMYWLRKSSFPKTQKAKFQLSIDSK